MIDIKELRVGNWITELYSMSDVRVLKMDEGEVWISPTDHGYADYDLIGIELTPEILEKCGFALEDKHWKIDDLTWTPYTDPSTKALTLLIIVKWQDDKIINYDVQYLHQLQNLYYTITQKELKVEL